MITEPNAPNTSLLVELSDGSKIEYPKSGWKLVTHPNDVGVMITMGPYRHDIPIELIKQITVHRREAIQLTSIYARVTVYRKKTVTRLRNVAKVHVNEPGRWIQLMLATGDTLYFPFSAVRVAYEPLLRTDGGSDILGGATTVTPEATS